MVAFNDVKLGEKIRINLFLLAGVSLLIIVHLISLYISSLAILIAILENLIIYFFIFKKNCKTALIFMCLFYTTSYSNALFFGSARGLDTVYSVENLPLFHGYLMLLSFIVLFVNVKCTKRTRIRKKSNSISVFAVYTICSGLLMGLCTILINGFQYRAIISDLNQCVNPALMILVFLEIFEEDPLFANKYVSIVIHILLSYVIIAWFTTTLNIYADFVQVRDKVIMLPLPSFYISSIILFIGLMKTYRDRLMIFIAFISTVYFQLSFDSCMNGKSWIVFVATILISLYYISKRLKRNYILYATVFILLGFFTIKILPQINSFITDTKNTKLLEFVSMFEAANSGDLDDMDESSRFRIIEFLNVTDQYMQEPFFALAGRGYGGSIHANGFFIVRSESGFTDDQYDSDKFYRLHESMNVIYLKFGLIGLFFFISILIKLVKGVKYSPWCFLGAIWFFFFWGYENALLFIGLPAMIYGFICANQKGHSILIHSSKVNS